MTDNLDSIDLIAKEEIKKNISPSNNSNIIKIISNGIFTKKKLIFHASVIAIIYLLIFIYKPLQIVNIKHVYKSKNKKVRYTPTPNPIPQPQHTLFKLIHHRFLHFLHTGNDQIGII